MSDKKENRKLTSDGTELISVSVFRKKTLKG